MAEAIISVDQDQFICPVCLDLLQDPVTIPCGHNCCEKCITDVWDQDDQKGTYRCPLCKQSFTPRPVLGKNMVVAEMVEKLRKMRLQATPAPAPPAAPPPDPPALVHAGSGDVQCDSCTAIKQKAVKSCLDCRRSYCQIHLEQHESLFGGNKHNLMDATGRLQEMICPRHHKMLEVYCHTDQRCLCMMCLVDEHKHHNTVSTAAARTEKQKHLGETQIKLDQKIQKKEDDIEELRGAVATHKRSAQTAVEDSERIVRSIEKSYSEVTQLIRDQERAAVSRAEMKLQRLEKELDDLKRKDAELKKISQTDDHIHFLQSLSSATVSLSGSTDGYTVSPHLTFEDVVKSFSQLRDKLLQFSREKTEKITETVKTIQVIIAPDYETREDFLQYFHPFTLDPNTVHSRICLSENNTVITSSSYRYSYPDHPDRFGHWFQALCTESVTGCCYWEVEWSGDEVGISVAYKSTKRKSSSDSRFGYDDQSCRLYCCDSSCSFWYNNIKTQLPVVSSSRIGVYVDYSTGTLSFLSVSDKISLIYRLQTTFTQPLYPAIALGYKATAKLCRLTM